MSDTFFGPNGVFVLRDKGTQPSSQTNSICLYSKDGQLTMTNSAGEEIVFERAIIGQITMVFLDISIYPTATHRICDGTNGTPPLEGLFVRGASSAVGQEFPGSPARRNDIQDEEIKAHSHVIERDFEGSPGVNVAFAANEGVSNAAPTSTQNEGGVETRPRNFALTYIMRYA